MYVGIFSYMGFFLFHCVSLHERMALTDMIWAGSKQELPVSICLALRIKPKNLNHGYGVQRSKSQVLLCPKRRWCRWTQSLLIVTIATSIYAVWFATKTFQMVDIMPLKIPRRFLSAVQTTDGTPPWLVSEWLQNILSLPAACDLTRVKTLNYLASLSLSTQKIRPC